LTFAQTYPPRILADFFESFVGEAQIDPSRFRTGTDGRPRIGSQSIEQIAAQLQTPRRVREFVRQLSALPLSGLFTAEHVTEALKSTHGGNTLRSWYQHLDEQRHHHLLALAIYLFDGLAEKQFFAAVDMAIAQAWRQRDPWLRSLDYKDLAYLEHFFQFVSTKQGTRALRTRSPEERRMLLDIVWNEQRRSIASALHVFYDYISQSQKPQPYSELYGCSCQTWWIIPIAPSAQSHTRFLHASGTPPYPQVAHAASGGLDRVRVGPSAPVSPTSASTERRRRYRQRQERLRRPASAGQSGRHRRRPLPIALGPTFATPRDRLRQHDPQRLVGAHEVIIGPPPL